MNLNKVFLLGRLTADPQLRTTASGQQVGTFAIATNRAWTDRAGVKQEEVQYHNIVVWGRQAEIAQRFLNKGGLVLIEGRLQTRAWDDKQGQKRKTTEIVADRIQLGPRPFGVRPPGGFGGEDSAPSGATAAPAAPSEMPTIELDVDPHAPGEAPSEGGEGGDIKPEDLNF